MRLSKNAIFFLLILSFSLWADSGPHFSQEFCLAIEYCGFSKIPENATSNCGGAISVYNRAIQKLADIRAGRCGLSDEEIVLLNFYSSGGYQCLNNELRRTQGPLKEYQILVDILNQALKKLPSYRGLVRRGTTLPDFVKAKHLKGQIVSYESFTSASTYKGFGGQDQFTIYSVSGHMIMSFSEWFGEGEVLFKSGTKFEILDVIQTNNYAHYVLKEVNPELEANEDVATNDDILRLVDQQRRPGEMTKADIWKCPLPEKDFNKVFFQKEVPLLPIP